MVAMSSVARYPTLGFHTSPAGGPTTLRYGVSGHRHRLHQPQGRDHRRATRTRPPGTRRRPGSRALPRPLDRPRAGRRAPRAGHALSAHQGQPERSHPQPARRALRRRARRRRDRRARDRLGRTAHQPGAGRHLRERVQGHRPRPHGAAPRRRHGLRDGRRDLQVPAPRHRRHHRPHRHRRLPDQRRLRGRHRLVHGPAGQPPAVRDRRRGRHRRRRRPRGQHRRALQRVRQVRHDPRPAEGLPAARGPARACATPSSATTRAPSPRARSSSRPWPSSAAWPPTRARCRPCATPSTSTDGQLFVPDLLRLDGRRRRRR